MENAPQTNNPLSASTPRPKRSLVLELPQFLSFSAGEHLLRAACHTHFSWLQYRLRIWFPESRWHEQLNDLPLERRRAFVLSPTVHHDLSLHHLPHQTDRDLYTRALGGDESSIDMVLGLTDTSLDLSGCRSLRCCKDGRAAYLCQETVFGSLRSPTPAEVAEADSRLIASLELLDLVSPVAASMFWACTQMLVRLSIDDSDRFFSASHRNLIGRVTLGNAHSHSTERLMDALVHEAVHSLLYKVELHEAFFLNITLAGELRAISPWSGRNLSLTSYVHACFVWFALANFWRLASGKRIGAEHMLDRAQAGFRGDFSTCARVLTQGSCVAPTVIYAVECMWEQMRLEA